ncbi:3-deoxy-D-manno-octulosonate cytidylyltransferase [Moritella viscosa]|uniref:3-deoxy-manno-octulosonate cytidylyltransferase n=1 Tax=Moritella viscosa TaxID=80854 RepID=UPI000911DDBA|nr:3-deoxy-manno-octulosonate cytidylyltransferase [Moritella viscosa]SGY94547.1 3-deoxy-D-manno-octulosonate cytidylyltransferase [Moritella viscosa]
MKYAVVIPARYQSSRFPGKPLIELCGKPMIQHVWLRCCEAVGVEKVYIATDDDRIEFIVKAFGGLVIRTSSECLTGTDRIAEANRTLDCDFIINVQGDEPLINPEDIITIANAFINGDGSVVNAMCEISDEKEFRSLTVPKVVCSPSGKLLYMSRAGIPLTKAGEFKFGFKQVCIYAFSKDHLEFFISQKKKTPFEEVEDIEILRFIESNFPVRMIRVASGSIAIDVPADVERVVKVLSQC